MKKDWSRWIRVFYDEQRRDLFLGPRSRADVIKVARAYDVPPWILDPTLKRPRRWRLRWLLRRIRPGLIWPDSASTAHETAHDPTQTRL